MKIFHFILSVVAFILLAEVSLKAQSDTDQIKAVIEKETASFMNVDYKTWSSLWHQVPYVYWSYSDSTGTSFIEGWDQLKETYAHYFKNSKPAKSEITHEWIEIRIYQDGAYAHFIQKIHDETDHDETSQMRVLEKKDGKWKLICLGAVAKYPR